MPSSPPDPAPNIQIPPSSSPSFIPSEVRATTPVTSEPQLTRTAKQTSRPPPETTVGMRAVPDRQGQTDAVRGETGTPNNLHRLWSSPAPNVSGVSKIPWDMSRAAKHMEARQSMVGWRVAALTVLGPTQANLPLVASPPRHDLIIQPPTPGPKKSAIVWREGSVHSVCSVVGSSARMGMQLTLRVHHVLDAGMDVEDTL